MFAVTTFAELSEITLTIYQNDGITVKVTETITISRRITEVLLDLNNSNITAMTRSAKQGMLTDSIRREQEKNERRRQVEETKLLADHLARENELQDRLKDDQ